MKRFTDTNKWDDPWFHNLQPKYKLLWNYITDKCDNAGVYKPNFPLASFCIGETIDENIALKVLNQEKQRIKVLPNGNWHIADFIFFQYGELSQASKPHLQVISLIKKHNLWKEYAKGMHTLKEKDKDKEKEKEKDKEEGKGKAFQNPTLEELNEYIKENNFSVESETFFNFYESNGWKVGKNSMKDWKAAVRNWQSKNKYKSLEQRVGKQAVRNIDSFRRFNQKMEALNLGVVIEVEVPPQIEGKNDVEL